MKRIVRDSPALILCSGDYEGWVHGEMYGRDVVLVWWRMDVVIAVLLVIWGVIGVLVVLIKGAVNS